MVHQRLFLLFTTLTLVLSGCASGTFKARQEQREKLAASSGMYCEFVSGDLFPDLDVELSMQMARRCDSGKSFSITNYKNSSDQVGVIYCCSTAKKSTAAVAPKKSQSPNKSEGAADSESEIIAE